MFERVVVGVDGSDGGRDAAELARQLLSPTGQVILANVYSDAGTAGLGGRLAVATERDRAHALLNRCRQDNLPAAETVACFDGSPGPGLHEIAAREHADLLVVGSSHRGLVGRILIGDDTLAALDRAPCAVAIAPRDHASAGTKWTAIGVGYDGSPESEHALAMGRTIASHHGAKLLAFTAVSVPSTAFGPGPLHVSDVIDPLVDQARNRIAALGGVEPHVAYGATADELTQFSGSVDLLIVGSHGYGPIERLIHGSTSEQLARSAHCPMLVLPRSGVDETQIEMAHDPQGT
jgi:nucleotide-binding universal stress UspA family protein